MYNDGGSSWYITHPDGTYNPNATPGYQNIRREILKGWYQGQNGTAVQEQFFESKRALQMAQEAIDATSQVKLDLEGLGAFDAASEVERGIKTLQEFKSNINSMMKTRKDAWSEYNRTYNLNITVP